MRQREFVAGLGTAARFERLQRYTAGRSWRNLLVGEG
jgi:hypothetical protein